MKNKKEKKGILSKNYWYVNRWKKIRWYKYFFTDETNIDIAPNTSKETIRICSKVKNKLKLGDEEGFKIINRETKNLIHQ